MVTHCRNGWAVYTGIIRDPLAGSGLMASHTASTSVALVLSLQWNQE